MFKKFVLLFLWLIVFEFQISNFKLAYAIYDPLSVPNNKFGIHVLEPGETKKAAELVNSSGGDWGYITVPIRANDRDLAQWTAFMENCKKLHLIPILRIASFPVEDHWMAPNEWDLVDFSNFLSDLPWPTKNRYVMVYNEPNHEGEWGGFVYPEEYARVLDRAVDIFHKKHADYFVISAGFDSSAASGNQSENEYLYMRTMNDTVPGIFSKVDGFSSHAYGNPAFTSAPNIYSAVNVANYRFEERFLQTLGVDKPLLFLTEAGWQDNPRISAYYSQAFTEIWTDSNIVAITPFLLGAFDGPFASFSFTTVDGSFKPFAREIQKLPKLAGQPPQAPPLTSLISKPSEILHPTEPSIYNPIEAFFKKLIRALGI